MVIHKEVTLFQNIRYIHIKFCVDKQLSGIAHLMRTFFEII